MIFSLQNEHVERNIDMIKNVEHMYSPLNIGGWFYDMDWDDTEE